MISGMEAHNKIMSILERRGPSVPMQLAKEMNLSSLFISAFLSEMVDSKKIRVSNLKLGGSPLYFVDKDENKLEQFYTYLHPKEAEAFIILKKNKAIRDRDQEPAIRVALRSLTDFAFSFNFENELYWRYQSVPEIEARMLLFSLKNPQNVPQQKDVQKETMQKKSSPEIISSVPLKTPHQKLSLPPKQKFSQKNESTKSEFVNPLVTIVEKPKRTKLKSLFVLQTIEFLQKNGLQLIEEKEHKAKEFIAIVEIQTDLGPMQLYTQAKDKKNISESDLKQLLSTAQRIPLPALMLYTGELSKKSKDYIKTYSSILKAKKIE